MLRLKSRHRIMCGDSTSEDDVAKLMDGEKADMVYTDPPYGIEVNTDWSAFQGNGFKQKIAESAGYTKEEVKKIQFTESYKHEKIKNDDKLLDIFPVILKHASVFYIWGGNYFAQDVPRDIYKNSSYLIWDKNGGHENLDKTIGSSFEQCLVFPKRKQNIVYRTWRGVMGKGDGSGFLKNKKTLEGDASLHPSQKPVRLHIQVFEIHNIKSDILVLDLFLGSGSTLIACEKTDRRCYGMELDEHYMSVILKRYEDYTGEKAVRL